MHIAAPCHFGEASPVRGSREACRGLLSVESESALSDAMSVGSEKAGSGSPGICRKVEGQRSDPKNLKKNS
ncbi:hypothetical protein TNCV_4055061 [Trichonephila clavipes]|nr:hypothetical protein TNCV_4055061 [Trichonephila clavipes]